MNDQDHRENPYVSPQNASSRSTRAMRTGVVGCLIALSGGVAFLTVCTVTGVAFGFGRVSIFLAGPLAAATASLLVWSLLRNRRPEKTASGEATKANGPEA